MSECELCGKKIEKDEEPGTAPGKVLHSACAGWLQLATIPRCRTCAKPVMPQEDFTEYNDGLRHSACVQ